MKLIYKIFTINIINVIKIFYKKWLYEKIKIEFNICKISEIKKEKKFWKNNENMKKINYK